MPLLPSLLQTSQDRETSANCGASPDALHQVCYRYVWSHVLINDLLHNRLLLVPQMQIAPATPGTFTMILERGKMHMENLPPPPRGTHPAAHPLPTPCLGGCTSGDNALERCSPAREAVPVCTYRMHTPCPAPSARKCMPASLCSCISMPYLQNRKGLLVSLSRRTR